MPMNPWISQKQKSRYLKNERFFLQIKRLISCTLQVLLYGKN